MGGSIADCSIDAIAAILPFVSGRRVGEGGHDDANLGLTTRDEFRRIHRKYTSIHDVRFELIQALIFQVSTHIHGNLKRSKPKNA